MSKVGKVIGQAAESVMKTGGVVTKRGGEVISGLGKTMGISEEACSKFEEKAEDLGKDMYYASGKVGDSVKNFSDEITDKTKKAYYTVKDKLDR